MNKNNIEKNEKINKSLKTHTFKETFKLASSRAKFSLGFAFCLSIILFIVATFYDLQISNKAYYLMKFTTTKIWVCLGSSFGSLIPFWTGYFIFVLMVEIRITKMINNENRSKFSSWIVRNKSAILWTLYIFLICCVLFYCFYWFINYGLYTFDIRLVYKNHIIRTVCDTLSIFFCLFVMLSITIYMRCFFKNNNKILETNIEIQGFKVISFYILSYCSVWFFKHLFGRPFYFSVIFKNKVNGAPWTIEDLIKNEYGYSESDGVYNPDVWKNAKYLPWYKPNHIEKNLSHWFKLDIGNDFFYRTDFNQDSWWNNDFPSGHVTAYSILFSVNSMFKGVHFKKDQKGIINKTMYWISYLLVFLIAVQMVVYGFHWVTDVMFSMFTNIIYWVLCSYVVDKISSCCAIKNQSKSISKE